jgi:membrane fusion protein, multidrug efflux system
MKIKYLMIPGTLALLLSAVSCGKKEQVVIQERTTAVRVEVVQSADEDVVRSFSGSLEGERQAVLYSKLAEAVDKVHAREGSEVKAEQVVVSLDKCGPSSHFNEAQ